MLTANYRKVGRGRIRSGTSDTRKHSAASVVMKCIFIELPVHCYFGLRVEALLLKILSIPQVKKETFGIDMVTPTGMGPKFL